jgi:hypothetical protein
MIDQLGMIKCGVGCQYLTERLSGLSGGEWGVHIVATPPVILRRGIQSRHRAPAAGSFIFVRNPAPLTSNIFAECIILLDRRSVARKGCLVVSDPPPDENVSGSGRT